MRIYSLFLFFLIGCCLFLAACSSSSATSTLDQDRADSSQITETPKTIEIHIGMKDTAVLQLLGPADTVETGADGRSVWRYSGKRAEYVYVSNRDNGQTLVIGDYAAGSSGGPGGYPSGLPLLMTFVFDPSKKVENFNFAQIAL